MSTSIEIETLLTTIKQLEVRISDLERQQRTIGNDIGTSFSSGSLSTGPVLGPNAKGIDIDKNKIRFYTNSPDGTITHSFDLTWSAYYYNVIAPGTWYFDQDIIISNSQTPASSTASTESGKITWDSNYIYVAVGTNQWKRIPLNSF